MGARRADRHCSVLLAVFFVFSSLLSCAHAEWFPQMSLSDAKWGKLLKNVDLSSSYQTCKNVHTSGSARFINLFYDKPVTFVLTGTSSGNFDVKFKDSNYIFEQHYEVSKSSYMIIPPYQPVEWILMRASDGPVTICAYEGARENSETGTATKCDCSEIVASAREVTSATFPRTIRKPTQQFFLTADVTPAPDDVTICTILTVDRMLRLSQMSEFWGGPISAAVYLHELSEISEVMEWYMKNSSLRRHVDIHLVHDDKIIAFQLPDRPFPVNILRNVAVRFARTSNVFYIEGDFIPSPDLYPNLGEAKRRLAKGEKTVFIVAPFSIDKADYDMSQFPKDKEDLQQKMHANRNSIKDLSYFNSHAAFNFEHWYQSKSIYSMPFNGGYEPYYIGPKNYPLFEEIFIGCGQDKVSHPSELNSAGYSFNVLPTGFIVHIDSTGMGSAWCRGWAGNERSTMKWEAFTAKTNHIYRGDAKGSYDSRIPWWDLAPVTSNALPAKANADEEVCTAPPPKEDKEKECPPCEEFVPQNNPACPPASASDCRRFTDNLERELQQTKTRLKTTEDASTKREKHTTALETAVRNLQKENQSLQEYVKFVVNLATGIVVVLLVVVCVGARIWPRGGKKVWALPTKSNDHSL